LRAQGHGFVHGLYPNWLWLFPGLLFQAVEQRFEAIVILVLHPFG
jgi:hypothetical protein